MITQTLILTQIQSQFGQTNRPIRHLFIRPRMRTHIIMYFAINHVNAFADGFGSVRNRMLNLILSQHPFPSKNPP